MELTGPVTRLEVAVRDLERDVAAFAGRRDRYTRDGDPVEAA